MLLLLPLHSILLCDTAHHICKSEQCLRVLKAAAWGTASVYAAAATAVAPNATAATGCRTVFDCCSESASQSASQSAVGAAVAAAALYVWQFCILHTLLLIFNVTLLLSSTALSSSSCNSSSSASSILVEKYQPYHGGHC
jgi:hypothetical protein